MKWFRHDADSHNNLKFQDLLDKYKMMGYGVFWICCEMVASQVELKELKFQIPKKRDWKRYLRKKTGISGSTLDAILQVLADCSLIDKKALKRGSLSIPKMEDRMDEYSIAVSRGYRESKYKVNTKYPNNTTQHITTQDKTGSSKKPYYKGQEMRKKGGKWWVLPEDSSSWLEFAGKKEDIEYL